MVFGLFDGKDDGEYSGVGFVEISLRYLSHRTHFSSEKKHLTDHLIFTTNVTENTNLNPENTLC